MQSFFFSTRTLFAILCMAMFSICLPSAQAQFFEQTISPALTLTEEAVDGKQIPTTDHFMMLSNTFQYGQDVMALTEMKPTGTVVQRTIVWMPGTTSKFRARSLEVAMTASGAPMGYWITGSETNALGDKRLVLVQTNLNGQSICVRYLDNRIGTTIGYDEEGVSLERQPNGDIIVVGESLKRQTTTGTPPTQRMLVARFPAGCGAPIWSFRYNQPTGYHLLPAESCNGIVGTADVVGITGRVIDASGMARAYGACVDAATGAEIWRRVYNGGGLREEGTDIVQNPANQKFMIVGRSMTTPSQQDLWVFNVAALSGALVANTGALYSMPAGGSISGTDVCLSTTGTRAIIAGRCQIVNSTGGFSDYAYLLSMSFANCAPQVWFRYYEASSPVAGASESVVPVVPTGAAVAGYFMTTSGFPTNSGWVVNGAHPTYVNTVGTHAILDCPTPSVTLLRTCVGTSVTLAKTKTAATWIPGQLGWEILVYQIAACDGILPSPLVGSDDRSISNPAYKQASNLMASPNPLTAGQPLNVNFISTQEGTARVMLSDMTGRLILEQAANVEHGRLNTSLETNTLTSGAYFLQVRTSSGIETVKILIQ